MWYIDILNPLLKRVSSEEKEVTSFLVKLFTQTQAIIYGKDTPMSVGMLLNVIEKSYAKFLPQENFSVPLSQFTQYLFGLIIVCAKADCDEAIHDIEFLPVFAAVFNSPNSKANLAAIKAWQLDTLKDLQYSVTVSLSTIEMILWYAATAEMRQLFSENCRDFQVGRGEEFNLLVGYIALSTTLQELKCFMSDRLPLTSQKEDILALIEQLETEWQQIEKILQDPEVDDRKLIGNIKNAFRVKLLTKIKSILPDFSLDDAKGFCLTFEDSLLSPVVEEIKALLNHPAILAIEQLIEFNSTWPGEPILEELCAQLREDIQQPMRITVINNGVYQQKLFNAVDDFFFQKTTWPRLKAFHQVFSKNLPSLFSPLAKRFANGTFIPSTLRQLHDTGRELSFNSPSRRPFIDLITALQQHWQTLDNELDQQTAVEGMENVAKFEKRLVDDVKAFFDKNDSLELIDCFCGKLVASPYFSDFIQTLSLTTIKFRNHPISNYLQQLGKAAKSEANDGFFMGNIICNLHIELQRCWEHLFEKRGRQICDSEKSQELHERFQTLLHSKDHLLHCYPELQKIISQLDKVLTESMNPEVGENKNSFFSTSSAQEKATQFKYTNQSPPI